MGTITHNYGTAGTYTVCIRGTFPQIYFNNKGDKLKILEVKQWGTRVWRTMGGAFYGASNLDVTANDELKLGANASMASMFRGASSLTGNASFNNWDTSNVINMSYMFNNAGLFNQPIGDWNVSNVTNMRSLFNAASSFNRSLASWNV